MFLGGGQFGVQHSHLCAVNLLFSQVFLCESSYGWHSHGHLVLLPAPQPAPRPPLEGAYRRARFRWPDVNCQRGGMFTFGLQF